MVGDGFEDSRRELREWRRVVWIDFWVGGAVEVVGTAKCRMILPLMVELSHEDEIVWWAEEAEDEAIGCGAREEGSA